MLRANHVYRATQSRHLIGARRANKIILIAAPVLVAVAIQLEPLTRKVLNDGNLALFQLLSSLMLLIYASVVFAPGVSMVAASIARRKAPPVEQVAAAS
jgi:hypothetical protein